MRRTIVFLLILAIGLTTVAQINTNLVLSAAPPAALSEWSNRKEVLTYIIIGNAAGLNFQVKIKAEIKTADGTLVANTDLARSSIFTISQGNIVLGALDVVPLEFMLFTGSYKTSLARSGKLPAGNYTLCVQLVRPVDYTPASEIKCRSFYLASLQLPILMKPYKEEVLDAKMAQTAITFRWTPLVPGQTSPITYHLQVFEVLDNQSPMQALRSNQPLLEKTIRGTTQYIWQPQLSFIDNTQPKTVTTEGKPPKGKLFIWTIQTLDAQGNPITQTDSNGEARSEPQSFSVDPNKYTPPEKSKPL